MLQRITGSVLLLGLGVSATLPAQDAGGVLEEVTITAQKRAESLQDTPLAVTALSGNDIEAMSRSDVAGLAFQTPSLAYSEAGGESQIYIRGVGSNLFSVGADSSVAINIDGVYLGRANMGLTQFLDVERVEVLRGPQGTLYGRNATGGAINVISRMPTEDWEGYGALSIGSFDRREVRGAISGPISDKWSFRVAVRGEKDDGYTDDLDSRGSNELDDNDLRAGRAILRFEPDDSLSATLISEYSEMESGNTSIRPVDNLGLAESAGAVTPADFHSTRNNTPSFMDWQTGGVTLNVEWALSDSLDLTWISAYRAWDSDFLFNTDGTEIEVTRTTFIFDTKQYSSELRFTGTQGWGRWIAGAYYLEEDKFGALGLVRSGFTNAVPPPVLNPAVPPQSFIIQGQNDGEAYAFFGQLDFNLGEAWTLTAGVRYSDETKDDFNTQSALNPDPELLGVFSPRPIPAATPMNTRRDSASWDAWTPKVGLEWRPLDDVLLYASYTKGFKSGGFNDLQPSNPPYDPEFIKSYEIGTKTTWLDNRLRVNASVFYYDYTDLQVNTFLNSLTFVTNAAEATIKGLELEIEARPVPELQLAASLAVLDATYDEFNTPYGRCTPANAALDPANCAGTVVAGPRIIDASGNTLNNAPDFKGTASARYFVPLPSGRIELFGQVAYQDEVYFNSPANDPVASQEAITLVDARVGWENDSGALSVAAFGKNLTDEEYFHNIVQFTSTSDANRDIFAVGNGLGYAAAGRTWGLEVMYRFGQ